MHYLIQYLIQYLIHYLPVYFSLLVVCEVLKQVLTVKSVHSTWSDSARATCSLSRRRLADPAIHLIKKIN